MNTELKAVASIAGRHKMMRGVAERKCDSMTKLFILMCADHDPSRLFDMLPVWKTMDSGVFGITSIIKDYTNKKGITFKAHFTIHDKFLRKATENEKPISYIGNFRVCKEAFQIDMDKMEEIVGLCMEPDSEEIEVDELFMCKDTDDIPLEYLGNTGRIARGNY
jgi:hypothetical protein